MASIKASMGWKRPRKKENESYRFVLFPPDAEQKIPKKKQKKLKKNNYGIISSQNSFEKAKKDRK